MSLSSVLPSLPYPSWLGVKTLRLQGFRNHAQKDFTITRPLVVLCGENGVGKTNILEALSLLSPGRGFRGSKLSHMCSFHDPKPWVVSCTLETDLGLLHVGTSLAESSTTAPLYEEAEPPLSERRIIRINQGPVKTQSVLSEWLNVVWIVPAMARLFDEGSNMRRRFVDRMVLSLDPTHSERVNRYDHLLRERSLLLKRGERGGSWLGTLEQRLAEDGVAIAIARAQLVRALTESQPLDRLSPFPRFFAQMQGDVEEWCRQGTALEAENQLLLHFERSRQQDSLTGGSAYGPHRGDLSVDHLSKQIPAPHCSTGEQKILVIALILAYIQLLESLGTSQRQILTLLLLDDVVAHLDQNHRAFLFHELLMRLERGVNLQVWMSGTNPNDFSDILPEAQLIML